jgi:IclR family transcriptional regulator, acetate operon repressor
LRSPVDWCFIIIYTVSQYLDDSAVFCQAFRNQAGEDRKMAAAPRPGSTLKTIDKALTVLGFFTVETAEYRLSDLARAADIDKVTMMRILASLALRGFVEQNAETRKYRLGPAVLRLARVREASFPLLAVLQPVLARLSQQSDETAHAAEFDGETLNSIGVHEPDRGNRINVRTGVARSLHATASGMAALAASTDSFIAEILSAPLEAYTDHTITQPDAMWAEISAIRKRGYSVSNQAREMGVSSVAAAFCDRSGVLIGTVSLAMPTDRAEPSMIARLGPLVATAATQIEHSLFGRELALANPSL